MAVKQTPLKVGDKVKVNKETWVGYEATVEFLLDKAAYLRIGEIDSKKDRFFDTVEAVPAAWVLPA